MNSVRKYFASLLLLFALFAVNGAEFFHHHHPGEINVKEDKCEACIIHSTLHSAAVEHTYILNPHIVFFSVVTIRVNTFLSNPALNTVNDRAPPSVSHT